MTTHNITLDLDKTLRTPPPLVTARQGDTQCGIAASVTDHGAPASLAGYTARFQAAKPDGTYADQTADIDGSIVSVTLAPEFLAAEGLIKTAYFRFFEGADEKESTQNLFIRVLHDAEGESPDPTGDYVSAVDDLIAEVQGALDDVNGAVEDASEATAAANSAASSANAAALEADAAAEAAQSALGAMTGNVLKGETEAGAVASAGDAYAQTPLGVKVYGETRQNLWVNPSGAKNGSTVSVNADGSVVINGKPTTNSSFGVDNSIHTIKPNTKYTISVDGSLKRGGVFGVREYNADGEAVGSWHSVSADGSATFTSTADVAYADCRIELISSSDDSGTYRVMLNEGSTAQPWCPPGLSSVGQLMDDEKNLWVNPSGTNNGVTVTENADGSVTISGTNTGGVEIGSPVYTLKPNTTYTASIDGAIVVDGSSASDSSFSFAVVATGGISTTNTNAHFGYTGRTSYTFATKDSVDSSKCVFYIGSTVDSGHAISGTYRVMLNEGSTPAPWVPPGCETAVQVATSGKNLLSQLPGLSPKTTGGVTFTPQENGGILIDGTATTTAYFDLDFNVANRAYFRNLSGLVGQTVTCSLGNIQNGINLSIEAFVNIDTNERKLICSTGSGATNIIPYDYVASRSFLSVGSGTTIDNVTVYPQLELGSTATDYEPPQPITLTPIDLDGHVLASLPDGTRDELVIGQDGGAEIKKAVLRTDLSTAEWTNNSSNSTSYIGGTSKKLYYSGTIDPSTNLCSTLATTDQGNENMPPYSVKIASSNPNGSVVGKWLNADQGNDAFQAAVQAMGGEYLGRLADVEAVSIPSVALPALPAPNFNAWVQPGECEVAGDISVEYAKDVNMVVGSLEERVAALEQLHAGGGE